jgi:uncharacterized membrane protein YgcG
MESAPPPAAAPPPPHMLPVFVTAPPPQVVPLLEIRSVPRPLQTSSWFSAMARFEVTMLVQEFRHWCDGIRASAAQKEDAAERCNAVLRLYNEFVSGSIVLARGDGGRLLAPVTIDLVRRLWRMWAAAERWPPAAFRIVDAEVDFVNHTNVYASIKEELARTEAARQARGRGIERDGVAFRDSSWRSFRRFRPNFGSRGSEDRSSSRSRRGTRGGRRNRKRGGGASSGGGV